MDTLPSSPVRGGERTPGIPMCPSDIHLLGLSHGCGCQLNTEEYVEVVLILCTVWLASSLLEPSKRKQIKCRCIKSGVVYLGARKKKSSPPRVLLTCRWLGGRRVGLADRSESGSLQRAAAVAKLTQRW